MRSKNRWEDSGGSKNNLSDLLEGNLKGKNRLSLQDSRGAYNSVKDMWSGNNKIYLVPCL